MNLPRESGLIRRLKAEPGKQGFPLMCGCPLHLEPTNPTEEP